MEEQQLFDVTFSKVYEEINNVTYSCENVLRRLCDSGLISENSLWEIERQKEAFDQNRFIVGALLKKVINYSQFDMLMACFSSEKGICEVAESMKVVYSVLKYEDYVIKAFNNNYVHLFTLLKKEKFFSKYEETILSISKGEFKEITEILKDKEINYFKTFLMCLNELDQDNLVNKLVCKTGRFPPDNFRYILQKRYNNESNSVSQNSEVDFNLPISDDINIALVEVNEEDHKRKSTFYDYHSVLLQQKSSYTNTRKFLKLYSDIVVDNCRVILMQGYPGSGKTFLAKRMCAKWAKGELLLTFNHVILLQLRDEKISNAETFDEIMGPLSENFVKQMYTVHGRGVLIILEGWDELPKQRQQSSLFTCLISGKLLSEAVIVITSRPSAIRSLDYDYIIRRIEILGFTDSQVKSNVTSYFRNYANSAELEKKFYSELKRLPLLECFVFVPINLCIALYIFNSSSYELPKTFTDMYKDLVLIQLKRHQTRNLHGYASISTLENLPEEFKSMLLNLGEMAYVHLQKDVTLIFDEAKIRQYCFDSKEESLDGFDGMGLLQVTNHKSFRSMSKTYEFIHRTLQELLAAWYLSQQSIPYQQKQLQNLFNKNDFEMIWIFYAGLTKFKYISFKEFIPENNWLKIKIRGYRAFSWFLRNVISNTFVKFPSVSELIDTFSCGKQYSHDLSHRISREFQATLIAAVMEAQNTQLCKDMCESYLFYGEPCWFAVPESDAKPQFLSALSYCIANSERRWMIQCKSFDKDGAENLLKYLTCCTDSIGNTMCVFDVDCSQSPISGIPKLLRVHQHLEWVILSNSAKLDENLMVEIAEVLQDNTCLKMLHLVGCKISSKGLKAVNHMLRKNKTLEWIGLNNNRATLTEEDIIMLLRTVQFYNNVVFMIFIDNSFYISDKIQEQLQILNDAREQRGIQKLSLTLLDCFKYHLIFQRVVSSIPFMQNQSPSSVTTKIAVSKDATIENVTPSDAGDATTQDLQPAQETTVYFGEYPVTIVCPKCHVEMTTTIKYKTGSLTLILVMALFSTVFLMMFMLWPLCLDLCKDVCHSCSKCKADLGIFKRM